MHAEDFCAGYLLWMCEVGKIEWKQKFERADTIHLQNRSYTIPKLYTIFTSMRRLSLPRQ